MAGGSCLRIACSVSTWESPLKACFPVRISKRTAPREKMSERASAGSPRTCSGDMYPIVPRRVPGFVS
jgi:hypothetical protein